MRDGGAVIMGKYDCLDSGTSGLYRGKIDLMTGASVLPRAGDCLEAAVAAELLLTKVGLPERAEIVSEKAGDATLPCSGLLGDAG
jgi:hypothetical protein